MQTDSNSKEKSYFDDFMFSIFGDNRDGPLDSTLKNILENGSKKAEEKILKILPDTNDIRPFQAAGMMNLTSAVPIIKKRFEEGLINDELKVFAAHALYVIDGWKPTKQILLDILNDKSNLKLRGWTRWHEAEFLFDFQKDPTILPVLFNIIEDDDDLIGFSIIGNLKKIYIKTKKVWNLLNKLESLSIKPMYKKPESLKRRQKIYKELERITKIKMPEVNAREEKPAIKKEFLDKQLPLI